MEIETAEMETSRNTAYNSYFEERPQLCIAGMPIGNYAKVFNAGFERGWKSKSVNVYLAMAELLEALELCDEAMSYMSEYDIPLTLPYKVKSAIAKAKGEL